jgi:hypothetical protein
MLGDGDETRVFPGSPILFLGPAGYAGATNPWTVDFFFFCPSFK